MAKKKKLPADTNKRAKSVVDLATQDETTTDGKNGATHILATVEENETTRQKIEKDILLAVNTSCNEVHN